MSHFGTDVRGIRNSLGTFLRGVPDVLGKTSVVRVAQRHQSQRGDVLIRSTQPCQRSQPVEFGGNSLQNLSVQMEPTRKRRKWDVTAPHGVPVIGNGAGALADVQQQFPGLITGIGVLPSPQPQSQPIVDTADLKPGQPLDPALVARAQMGAQAVVERIQQVLRRDSPLCEPDTRQETKSQAALCDSTTMNRLLLDLLLLRAARFSCMQDLMAKGKLPHHRVQQVHQVQEEKKEISRDVSINDAPPQIRFQLTKRTIQDEIQRRTGALIGTRGRYFPPGAPPDDSDKPLHLHITPGAHLPPVRSASPCASPPFPLPCSPHARRRATQIGDWLRLATASRARALAAIWGSSAPAPAPAQLLKAPPPFLLGVNRGLWVPAGRRTTT
jgi:hypothetical protein